MQKTTTTMTVTTTTFPKLPEQEKPIPLLLQKLEQLAVDKSELEAALMALGGLLAFFFGLFLVALRLAIRWRPRSRDGGDLEMGAVSQPALVVSHPSPSSTSSSRFEDAVQEVDTDGEFELHIRERLSRLRDQPIENIFLSV